MLRPFYKKMSIYELITLAQKNDIKALEELVRVIQREVHSLISYLVANGTEVSDLTQEVLIRVAKRIKDLKEPQKFKPWLNRIIYNVYYDEIRRRNKGCLCISIEDENCEDIVSESEEEPQEKCIAIELNKLVKSTILALPESFKIVIILREFMGLSYQEIAEITNVALGTVKSRIARARMILQNKLKNCL